ncbi:hypothetical protein HJC23_008228 [Cyclotella cryptica]|uniref:ATP-dependent rRNA helicase SPB4-like C-terminal extension domain-containing protein n=1 Tax=Cyclotella cryptica TaxID=29204 RepID=A0ABD3Q899_9STRA
MILDLESSIFYSMFIACSSHFIAFCALVYHRDILESIGVSNFGPTDVAVLYEHATVGPHVHMGTLRTLVEEEDTVEEIRFRRRIGDRDEDEMRCGDDCCWGREGGDGIVATFFNSLKRNVRIFCIQPKTRRQIQLSSSILPGKIGLIMVDVNDVLIPYDGHGVAVKKFFVEADDRSLRDIFDVHTLDLAAVGRAFGFTAPPKVDLAISVKEPKARRHNGQVVNGKGKTGKMANGHSFSASNPYGRREKSDKRQFSH